MSTPLAGTLALTLLAMLAFAGNSILCRLALRETSIGAIPFTVVRLASGAIALMVIAWLSHNFGNHRNQSQRWGSWRGAVALLGYAMCFSLAYLALPSGLGALILFAAVQCTMIGYGWSRGDRLSAIQLFGLLSAIIGLVYLLWPAGKLPTETDKSWLIYSSLMLLAGIAWGVYSLLAKGAGDPLPVTSGNFLRATVLVLPLALLSVLLPGASDVIPSDLDGIGYALISGAVTSGVGYAVWYRALKRLPTSIAATVQLSVPILVAFLGWLLLKETITQKHIISAVLVLGGVAVVIGFRRVGNPDRPTLPKSEAE